TSGSSLVPPPHARRKPREQETEREGADKRERGAAMDGASPVVGDAESLPEGEERLGHLLPRCVHPLPHPIGVRGERVPIRHEFLVEGGGKLGTRTPGEKSPSGGYRVAAASTEFAVSAASRRSITATAFRLRRPGPRSRPRPLRSPAWAPSRRPAPGMRPAGGGRWRVRSGGCGPPAPGAVAMPRPRRFGPAEGRGGGSDRWAARTKARWPRR